MYPCNRLFPNLQGSASEKEQNSLNQTFLVLPFSGMWLECKPSVSFPHSQLQPTLHTWNVHLKREMTPSWTLHPELSLLKQTSAKLAPASPFDCRAIDQTELLFQQLQVTTLPNHCHFSWRSTSVFRDNGEVPLSVLSCTEWTQTLLSQDSPPKPRVSQNTSSCVSTGQPLCYHGHSPQGELLSTPPTPSFSFPTPTPAQKFGSRRT